ncbi:toast rack family protein [Sporosarcina cascadiensis]|uniref:toast rack family protein n=1 Tax=Sporosarcina cascadiensis TaxID=2660747 RepID=UPI00129A8913|nr:toast rack family protein [Sporosarcina cascadiensis]
MRKIMIIIVAAGLMWMVGSWAYGLLKSDQMAGDLSIEKDVAKSLDVDIRFGAGNLLIEGGSQEWVNGTVDTNVKKWYPSVTYKNKKTIGYLEIQQKMKGISALRKNRNDWHLQLTNEVPVNLDVEMGVSDSELNLSGIRLSRLSVDAGVSDTTIKLGGGWKESFDGEIDLGVSDAEIHLPKETGVKVTVSKGIGSIGAKDFISKGKGVYVNEAYGHSAVQINLKIDLGVGDVKLLLAE